MKPNAWVFVEWRENDRYHGAHYLSSDVPQLVVILRHRVALGANISSMLINTIDRSELLA